MVAMRCHCELTCREVEVCTQPFVTCTSLANARRIKLARGQRLKDNMECEQHWPQDVQALSMHGSE